MKEKIINITANTLYYKNTVNEHLPQCNRFLC